MRDIPDDPIIACMERTGYPPWMLRYGDDEDDDYDTEFFDSDDDVYYGNDTIEF